MSAINVLRTRDAIQFCTDGHLYNPDADVVVGFEAKVFTAPHMPLMIATRGMHRAAFMLGALLVEAYSTFDELVANFEAAAPAIYQVYRSESGYPDHPNVLRTDIMLAGYSAARHQCEAYYLVARDGGEPHPNEPKPYALLEIQDFACAPTPAAAASDWSHFVERFTTGPVDDGQLVALMETQRAEWPIIGGFMQLSTLTADGIQQRVVHRWQDSVYANDISPSRAICPPTHSPAL